MATQPQKRDPEIEVALVEGQGWLRTMTVTVPTSRVSRTRKAEARRVSGSRRMKGFRKGKIPAAVLEQKYGAEIDERVQQRLLDEAYREALDLEELNPAGPGRITDVKYGPEEPFVFQAELEVMPIVRLERLGGFKLERKVAPVEEAEVGELLERIRQENADWKAVDREPSTGDRVSVRIAPLRDDPESTEDEGTQYQVVLGGGQALPGVEEAIVTLAPGGDGVFSVEFPDEEGADGDVVTRRLHVWLDGVEEQSLPELDDALASRIGSFESLADLDAQIREDLARHHENEAEGALRGELIAAIAEANPFVVPRSLIDRYVNGMLQAPEDVDPAELQRARDSMAPHAEERIREQLILDAVIEREGLEPSAEELEARIAEVADRRGMPPGQVRRELAHEGALESLGRNLAVEKAFDYLKEQSGIR